MTVLYAGTDTETTGVPHGDHRIIEIGIGLWKPGNLKPVFWYEQRIDPQRSIAAEAQRVHGISHSDLIGKPIWTTVAPVVQKVLAKATHYVWHNGDEFDGPFLEYELKREGLALPKRPSIDTMSKALWATPDGKKPKLAELCFACGVDYDKAKAHGAGYDIQVMMECFFKAQSWGFFEDPAAEQVNEAA
ncbi:3'-5' exonuclease [Mesorhizobium sp.]|uniref:3'-5' exonuclease n=1 Tax=Mesorhizobium sp. TaxID=1871066 RepID=UPI000FE7025D|nr:3'-5' exonuclease [Mesorhizobium sp.]RWI35502.1 MAG: 3'-5' exonuclease [Mesorhizobium sp.]RWJ66329.1 MAG: 3'-5' exonuclease [Mesorhizobium sp.]